MFLFLITPRFSRQTVFTGKCLKIQKRQLIRNEVVALCFLFTEYPFNENEIVIRIVSSVINEVDMS